jgi:chaperone modulatory protein CbpM
MRNAMESLEVQLLDESDWLAVQEFCRVCGLELATIVELAELGVIAPRGAAPEEWRLPAVALPRLRTAARLIRDLGVNVSGAALALELLDVQHELERQVRTLERLL